MLPWICKISSFRSSHCLRKFPSIFAVSLSTSTPEISIYDYLVNRHQFSPQCAEKVSSPSSSTKFLRKSQNVDSVINFFRENGFTKTQIETAVRKSPVVLSAKVEKSIKPKIKVFQDFGFHPADVAKIVSACPWYLMNSANKLRESMLVLKNVMGPYAIVKFLKSSSSCRIFSFDLNTRLVPNIEYLKMCGISSLLIVTHVCRYPTSCVVKHEKFKDLVRRVDEMGMPRESKMFIEAVRVMNYMTRKKWELKLKIFRELGFTEQNILHAFRKSPQAFAVSERKIKEVSQLLLSVVDISYIAGNPQLFTYSVEKRLKPRLRVIKALEGKNLLKKRPALTSICLMTDVKFIYKYVRPYSEEVGDLYVVKMGLCSKDSVLLITNS